MKNRVMSAALRLAENKGYENIRQFDDNYITYEREGRFVVSRVQYMLDGMPEEEFDRDELESIAVCALIEGDYPDCTSVAFDNICFRVIGDRALVRHHLNILG